MCLRIASVVVCGLHNIFRANFPQMILDFWQTDLSPLFLPHTLLNQLMFCERQPPSSHNSTVSTIIHYHKKLAKAIFFSTFNCFEITVFDAKKIHDNTVGVKTIPGKTASHEVGDVCPSTKILFSCTLRRCRCKGKKDWHCHQRPVFGICPSFVVGRNPFGSGKPH